METKDEQFEEYSASLNKQQVLWQYMSERMTSMHPHIGTVDFVTSSKSQTALNVASQYWTVLFLKGTALDELCCMNIIIIIESSTGNSTFRKSICDLLYSSRGWPFLPLFCTLYCQPTQEALLRCDFCLVPYFIINTNKLYFIRLFISVDLVSHLSTLHPIPCPGCILPLTIYCICLMTVDSFTHYRCNQIN